MAWNSQVAPAIAQAAQNALAQSEAAKQRDWQAKESQLERDRLTGGKLLDTLFSQAEAAGYSPAQWARGNSEAFLESFKLITGGNEGQARAMLSNLQQGPSSGEQLTREALDAEASKLFKNYDPFSQEAKFTPDQRSITTQQLVPVKVGDTTVGDLFEDTVASLRDAGTLANKSTSQIFVEMRKTVPELTKQDFDEYLRNVWEAIPSAFKKDDADSLLNPDLETIGLLLANGEITRPGIDTKFRSDPAITITFDEVLQGADDGKRYDIMGEETQDITVTEDYLRQTQAQYVGAIDRVSQMYNQEYQRNPELLGEMADKIRAQEYFDIERLSAASDLEYKAAQIEYQKFLQEKAMLEIYSANANASAEAQQNLVDQANKQIRDYQEEMLAKDFSKMSRSEVESWNEQVEATRDSLQALGVTVLIKPIQATIDGNLWFKPEATIYMLSSPAVTTTSVTGNAQQTSDVNTVLSNAGIEG